MSVYVYYYDNVKNHYAKNMNNLSDIQFLYPVDASLQFVIYNGMFKHFFMLKDLVDILVLRTVITKLY